MTDTTDAPGQREAGFYRVRFKNTNYWTEAYWSEGRWHPKTYTGIPRPDSWVDEVGDRFTIDQDVVAVFAVSPTEPDEASVERATQIVNNYLTRIGVGHDEATQYEAELVDEIAALAAMPAPASRHAVIKALREIVKLADAVVVPGDYNESSQALAFDRGAQKMAEKAAEIASRALKSAPATTLANAADIQRQASEGYLEAKLAVLGDTTPEPTWGEEREWLHRLLRWCRSRLKHESYQTWLDKYLALGPSPAPEDDPPIVQSTANKPSPQRSGKGE